MVNVVFQKFAVTNSMKLLKDCTSDFSIILIDWCLMPTLAVFQLHCGVNFFLLLTSKNP